MRMQFKSFNVITLVLLSIILAAGCFLRLYKIGSIPPGFHIDEGIYGLIGLDIVENRERSVYFNRMMGADSMLGYLEAISFSIVQPSLESLRLATAVIGTLTILGVYFFGMEGFGVPVGLFSAVLLAVSRWHIGISRIAIQPILVPWLATFTFYVLTHLNLYIFFS